MKLFATNIHLFKKENDSDKKALRMKKSIQIYKTNKFYKIITMYRTESGSYIDGEPVFLIPLDATLQEFSKVILEGLNHSRLISESEEAVIWDNRRLLLKEIKEKSYDDLYKNSTSCDITIENEEITIEPNIYLGSREGLVTDKERIVKLPFLEDKHLEITKVIMEILN